LEGVESYISVSQQRKGVRICIINPKKKRNKAEKGRKELE
jgi:hypothetical protein